MSQPALPFRNLILDMDGVLWHGDAPASGLLELFEALRSLGLDYVLATNNATRSAEQYVEKLAWMGVAVAAERILTSSQATAAYLRERFPAGAAVYPVGEAGLRQALEAAGHRLLKGEGVATDDGLADAVVVGLDRQACYPQLARAAVLIRRGAAFIGTNADLTLPTEGGLLPGAGSLLAFISAASGAEPTIIGKPRPALFEQALVRLGGRPADTVMVGDRIATDIVGAASLGMRTILLLSGVSGPEELAASPIKPTWVFAGLPELTAYLTRLAHG
jgi:4-nitrophenyl phosphatase